MAYLLTVLVIVAGGSSAAALLLQPRLLPWPPSATPAIAAGLLLTTLATALFLLRQQRRLKTVRQQNQYLELLLEQGSNSIVLLDRDLNVTYWNPRYAEMMQLDPTMLKSDFNVRRFGKYVPEKTLLRIERAVRQGKPWQGELRFPVAGTDLHTLISITPLLDENGHWEQLLVCAEDISKHKAIADRLFIQEHYSVLTGLPNRQLARKKLSASVDNCKLSGDHFVLAHIDIDRIRYLNDSLGHVIVDRLINKIAARLREVVGDEPMLSHIGADEFLLLFPDGSNLDEATAVAGKIVDAIRRPFFIENNEINITTSVGLTQFPNDGRAAEPLLRSAEAAMFAAKEEGGNRFCIFDETMSSWVEHRLKTENHLRHAIERDEFVLHFQPLIDLSSGQIIAAEVLLRWENAKLDHPPSEAFIQVAEDSGLIVPIGDWVLHQACQQAVRWIEEGLPPMRIAVNISAKQFRDGEIIKSVNRALESSGLPAQQLELEITEGLLINDIPNIRECLADLKAKGVRLSIDDFGTGYASLSYLKRYHFDTLKIDRSFVHDVDSSEDSLTLVNAIVAMAHSFDMEVVAEGVESLQQRRVLKERQCDMVQGYLYSPPLPAKKFAEWARRYRDIQLAQFV